MSGRCTGAECGKELSSSTDAQFMFRSLLRAFDSAKAEKLLSSPIDYIVSFESALREHIDFTSTHRASDVKSGVSAGEEETGEEFLSPPSQKYFVGFEGSPFSSAFFPPDLFSQATSAPTTSLPASFPPRWWGSWCAARASLRSARSFARK